MIIISRKSKGALTNIEVWPGENDFDHPRAQLSTSSESRENKTASPHMDGELKFQRWTFSRRKWARTTRSAPETLTLYRENLRGWSMKNRSKCNPEWSLMLSQHKIRWVWAIWGPPKASGSLPEGSEQHWNLGRVKMTLTLRRLNYQRLQILEKINSPTRIWMERLRAKYEPPHFKNEREQLWLRQQSHHYIKKI